MHQAPFIIDVHAHLGKSPGFYFPDASLTGMLKTMDRLGIAQALCTHIALMNNEWDLGLRASRRAYRQSRGRIRNYLPYNPNYAAATLRLIRRYLDNDIFVGIKIHPTAHLCPADDERYRPLWQLAHERQAVILAHTWNMSLTNPPQNYSYAGRFEKYLRAYPQAKMIFGHGGGRYRAHLETARLVRQYPQAWLDIATDSFAVGFLEWLVREADPRRILYASDLTWNDPRPPLGMVLGARISRADKLDILEHNAGRLFPTLKGT